MSNKLSQFLGVKVVKKESKTSNKTSTFKSKVNNLVKETIHNTLLEKFPNDYKKVSASGLKETKKGSGEYVLTQLEDYYLIEKTTIENGKESIDGFKLMKPQFYLEGGKGESHKVVDYKEVK